MECGYGLSFGLLYGKVGMFIPLAWIVHACEFDNGSNQQDAGAAAPAGDNRVHLYEKNASSWFTSAARRADALCAAAAVLWGVRRAEELVEHSDYTRFVGVDDYDAPSRRRFFTNPDKIDEPCLSQTDIESYIDSYFWGPLRKSSAAIDKLMDFEPSCGFAEHEALEFAQSILGEIPRIDELRHSCGEYTFSPPSSTDECIETVLHPQRLLTRLSELSLQPALHRNNDPFGLLSSILGLLPEESDVPGAVTTNGLITLVATGAVQIDEWLEAPLHQDGATLSWSALYYAGALTYDRQTPGILRLASSTVLSMIYSRVDAIIEPIAPFLRSYSLQAQTMCSFGAPHEPDLRGVLELVVGMELDGHKYMGFTPFS
ncbi:hypothetical protein B0H17DRAFT_1213053 [Mycena rosella]|uniref:Uncharacterized protein n=1 Tax=Mycena rosella TaxID=1033263 RepID=A0AAD7CQW4_MYCRO|nr:hypothetical protein B0H17DRAFT_1213053 [Mycena rosella]